MIQRKSARSGSFLCALSILMCMTAAFRAFGGDVPKNDDGPKIDKRLTRQLQPEALASENVAFYISTPDVKKVRAAFERSAFKALLGEDDILTPVTAAFGKLRDTYVKGDGTRSDADLKRRGEEVDLLVKMLPLLDSQAAIAIDGDTAGLNGITIGKLPHFLLIASLPPGDVGNLRQQDLEQMLDNYRGRLTIDAHYRDFDSDRGAYRIHGVENTDLGTYEAWTVVENLFIYGQGKGLVEDAIERYATKKGAGSLGMNAHYQSAFKQVGKDEKGESLIYVQFNPRALLGGNDKPVNPWIQYILALPKAMGNGETVNSQMAFGITVGEGNNAPIREKLYVRVPSSPEGAPKIKDGCKGQSARFVASDGLFYWATGGNLYDIYSQNKDVLATFFGSIPQMEQRLSGAMGAKEGTDFKKKMDLFKGEFSVFMDYAPHAAKLGEWLDVAANFQLVLCLEIDNENANYAAALKELMTKLETGSGVPYVTTNASGVIVRYQRGSAQGEDPSVAKLGLRSNMAGAEGKVTPFFASWAQVDVEGEPGQPMRHFVLLSDDLPALRKAMAQRSSIRTSLYEDARYKEVLKTFRESRSEIVYFDLAKLASIYNALMPVVTKAELIDRETVAQLPSVNALKPHLFPMAAARSMVSTGDGLLTEFSSPTGNLSLVALIGSVAWPAINAQRQRAISEEVDTKFKQIMLFLQLYAADFDRFPPQLSDLLTSNYVDPKRISIFESPFNRGQLSIATDVDSVDLTNLVYIPTRNMLDLGNDILMYEKQPTHLEKNDGKLLYHVLQVDGNVRHIPKAALDRSLAGKYSSNFVGDKSKGGSAPAASGAPVAPVKPIPPPRKK